MDISNFKYSIEETGTNYLNYKCKLVCNVHRSLFDHIIPDGRTCPDLVGTQYSNWVLKNQLIIIK
jgi:hypothetical protein